MSHPMAQLQEATIKAHCKLLRMPMVASQFGSLAEQAIREKQSHTGYLEALLAGCARASGSSISAEGIFGRLRVGAVAFDSGDHSLRSGKD